MYDVRTNYLTLVHCILVCFNSKIHHIIMNKTTQVTFVENSNLPNWIRWDKTKGKYCQIFEDILQKERSN